MAHSHEDVAVVIIGVVGIVFTLFASFALDEHEQFSRERKANDLRELPRYRGDDLQGLKPGDPILVEGIVSAKNSARIEACFRAYH